MGKRRLVVSLYTTAAKDTAKVIEQFWTVSADGGEEVVTRYSTDIATNGRWFTDNGLEMMPRARKDDKTPQKNYYPCPSTAYINDEDSVQFTVLTPSAMGVTSLQDGELEIMMHRHLLIDDGRGLAEAVSDSSVVKLTTWIIVDTPTATTEVRRHLSILLNHPMTTLQAKADATVAEWTKKYHWAFSALAAPLPDNVHMMTLRVRTHEDKETVSLRLVHTQEAGEANPLALQVSLDAASLFSGFRIEEVRESLLSFTGDMATIVANRWKWVNSGISDMASISSKDYEGEAGQNSDEKGVFISKAALEAALKGTKSRALLGVHTTSLQLSPREIKAFLLKMSAGGKLLVDENAVTLTQDQQQQTQEDEPEPEASGEQHHNIPPTHQQDLPRRPPATKSAARPVKRGRKPAGRIATSIVPTWLVVVTITCVGAFWAYRHFRGKAVRGGVRGILRGAVPVDASKLK